MEGYGFERDWDGNSYASHDTSSSSNRIRKDSNIGNKCTGRRCLVKPHQSSRPSRLRPDSHSGTRHGSSRSKKVMCIRAPKRLNSISSSTASTQERTRSRSIRAAELNSETNVRFCGLVRAVLERARKRKRKEINEECQMTRQHRRREEVKGNDEHTRKERQQMETISYTEQKEEGSPEQQHQLTWKGPSNNCRRCEHGKAFPDGFYLLSKKYWACRASRRTQVISKRRQGIKWLSAVCRDSSNWLEGVIGTEAARKFVKVASYVDESDYQISLWGHPEDGVMMVLPGIRAALLLYTVAILFCIGVVIIIYNAVVLFLQLFIPLLRLSSHSGGQ